MHAWQLLMRRLILLNCDFGQRDLFPAGLGQFFATPDK
jgi:hypothetical protein